MQRPPDGVRLVIEAVCIMFEVKPKRVAGEKPGQKIDDFWEPGKGLLKEPPKFLKSLFDFDKARFQFQLYYYRRTAMSHPRLIETPI